MFKSTKIFQLKRIIFYLLIAIMAFGETACSAKKAFVGIEIDQIDQKENKKVEKETH